MVVLGIALFATGLFAGILIFFFLGHNRQKFSVEKERTMCAGKSALFEEKLQSLNQKSDELKSNNIEYKKLTEILREENISYKSENAGMKEKLNRIEELSNDLKISKTHSEELINNNVALEKQVSQLETLLNKERKVSLEKLEILNNAQETLKKEFENISNKIFEDKRKKIQDQHNENLSTIITPLREQLKEFKQKVEDVYDKESKQRFSLQQEITSLKTLNSQIGEEAVNLTNALKGDHKKQGTWGEIILENVLQDSGLRKDREYITQFSGQDREGKRKRPDVIVRLPENKDVIIDSKVTLTAYEKYHSSDNLEAKSLALKEFISNIKNHINELSSKNYEDLPEVRTLDYVLMFIPIEGAFMTAIETDKKLFSNAFQKSIVLVSPATMLVVLKTIQSIWRYEYQNRNSKEIAERAGKLYDKFYSFIDSLKTVGRHIERADNEYHNAFKLLSQGRGNLVSQAEKIKTLGIKTKKTISQSLIEQDNIDTDLKKSESQSHTAISLGESTTT